MATKTARKGRNMVAVAATQGRSFAFISEERHEGDFHCICGMKGHYGYHIIDDEGTEYMVGKTCLRYMGLTIPHEDFEHGELPPVPTTLGKAPVEVELPPSEPHIVSEPGGVTDENDPAGRFHEVTPVAEAVVDVIEDFLDDLDDIITEAEAAPEVADVPPASPEMLGAPETSPTDAEKPYDSKDHLLFDPTAPGAIPEALKKGDAPIAPLPVAKKPRKPRQKKTLPGAEAPTNETPIVLPETLAIPVAPVDVTQMDPEDMVPTTPPVDEDDEFSFLND